jgi:hypothetical protein
LLTREQRLCVRFAFWAIPFGVGLWIEISRLSAKGQQSDAIGRRRGQKPAIVLDRNHGLPLVVPVTRT